MRPKSTRNMTKMSYAKKTHEMLKRKSQAGISAPDASDIFELLKSQMARLTEARGVQRRLLLRMLEEGNVNAEIIERADFIGLVAHEAVLMHWIDWMTRNFPHLHKETT